MTNCELCTHESDNLFPVYVPKNKIHLVTFVYMCPECIIQMVGPGRVLDGIQKQQTDPAS